MSTSSTMSLPEGVTTRHKRPRPFSPEEDIETPRKKRNSSETEAPVGATVSPRFKVALSYKRKHDDIDETIKPGSTDATTHKRRHIAQEPLAVWPARRVTRSTSRHAQHEATTPTNNTHSNFPLDNQAQLIQPSDTPAPSDAPSNTVQLPVEASEVKPNEHNFQANDVHPPSELTVSLSSPNALAPTPTPVPAQTPDTSSNITPSDNQSADTTNNGPALPPEPQVQYCANDGYYVRFRQPPSSPLAPNFVRRPPIMTRQREFKLVKNLAKEKSKFIPALSIYAYRVQYWTGEWFPPNFPLPSMDVPDICLYEQEQLLADWEPTPPPWQSGPWSPPEPATPEFPQPSDEFDTWYIPPTSIPLDAADSEMLSDSRPQLPSTSDADGPYWHSHDASSMGSEQPVLFPGGFQNSYYWLDPSLRQGGGDPTGTTGSVRMQSAVVEYRNDPLEGSVVSGSDTTVYQDQVVLESASDTAAHQDHQMSFRMGTHSTGCQPEFVQGSSSTQQGFDFDFPGVISDSDSDSTSSTGSWDSDDMTVTTPPPTPNWSSSTLSKGNLSSESSLSPMVDYYMRGESRENGNIVLTTTRILDQDVVEPEV